jgi:hypothetical protein
LPRGKIAVTPVRTESPSMSVVWPTATPGTSVIAFQRPGAPKSKGIPSARARTGSAAGAGAVRLAARTKANDGDVRSMNTSARRA